MTHKFVGSRKTAATIGLLVMFGFTFPPAPLAQSGKEESKVPVRVATVKKETVSEQISLIGTTEPIAESTVASEVSGLVKQFPVKEGDFIRKGNTLARLRTTYLKLKLEGARAAKAQTAANLLNAEKELGRVSKLKDASSVAEKAYDQALYTHQALNQELMQHQSEIEQLEYELSRTEITAPFSGFIAKEHCQVGEWMSAGGPVVDIINLDPVLIKVDVPERYVVKLPSRGKVAVLIRALSAQPREGSIYAVLPQGNPGARTFPVRVRVDNTDYSIKAGMEAGVTFNLSNTTEALLVPKDAIVTSGELRSVVIVTDGRAQPVGVKILGYHGSSVAVEGKLESGDQVVTRGNERLRPGQAVEILK